jgi:hypothetical protein
VGVAVVRRGLPSSSHSTMVSPRPPRSAAPRWVVRGQQAQPVVEAVTGQEADREQAQLGPGEEHDLGALPAERKEPVS